MSPATNAHDARAAKLYDIGVAKRLSMAGALYVGGVDVLLAARLAMEVAQEFEETIGAIPSNLENFRPANLTFPQPDARPQNEYWLRRALIRAGAYRSGVALDRDLIIEIVDRRFIFLQARGITTVGGGASLRVEGWDRGSAATVTHIVKEAGALGTPEGDARLKLLEAEFDAARQNALGMLSINCALAIRIGLDRIAARRGEP